MRRVLAGFALVAVVVATVAVVGFSQAEKKDKKKAKMVTVEGILVDTKCFGMMPAANAGNDHMTPKGKMPSCASACAKMGVPVALLTEKGDVVVLVAPASTFADHMAKEAKIKGTMVFDGSSIIPDKIEAKNKKGKWEEVKVATMM